MILWVHKSLIRNDSFPVLKRGLLLLGWVACLCLPSGLMAQSVDPFGAAPMIRHFSRKTYLAQHQNWSITCDQQGKVFVGNGNGLLVFDGAFWTLYPLPKGQIVRSVGIDPEGNLFTGGFGEHGRWQQDDRAGLKYFPLSPAPTNPQGAAEEIWHMIPRKGEVWFQSFSMIYRYKQGKMESILPPGNLMFMEDIFGRLVFQQIGGGLVELNADLRFSGLPGSESLADKVVKAILPLSDSRWVIGTEKHGIYLYDARKGLLQPWQNDISARFPDAQINRGIRLHNGNLAFGTILEGLFVISPEGRLLWRLHEGNGLQNNTVLSMAEDHQGNLWLGLDKGIDMVSLAAPVTVYNDVKGKLGVVYAAAQWQSKLFVGTNRGLFFRENGSLNEDFTLVPGSQGQVWELRVANRQLICGHNEGTFVYENGWLRRISEVTGGWLTLFKPGTENLLLQGTYTGLVRLQDGPGGWAFDRRVSGFSDPVREMAIDREGRLWVVSPFRGIFRLTLSADWSEVTQVQSIPLPIPPERQNELGVYATGDSVIVTATRQAWLAEGGEKGQLKPLVGWSGFPGKELKMDNDLRMRLMTGLVAFSRYGRSIRLPFQLVPGFERGIAIDSAHMLLCLEEGFAIFDLDRFGRWSPAPPAAPVISFFRAGHTHNPAWSPGKPQVAGLEVGPQPDEVVAGFAQPGSWGATRFRYRLLPVDTVWSAWSLENTARFIRLAPGDYRFEVMAEGNLVPATVEFSVKFKWYETLAARMSGLVLALLALFGLFRFNQWWLMRLKVKMEEEKARQVKDEIIRSTNEKLQADIRTKSNDLAHSTMHLVQKNELLMKIQRELSRLRSQPGMDHRAFDRLLRLIDENLSNEEEWETFEQNFNEIHDQFFKKLLEEHPDLTHGDLRLAALLRLNLSSKEIAPLLSISIRGVENKRYRLRKKIGLEGDSNLIEHLMRY